jgi:type II secretory pathway pseudopilin PulG
MSRGPQREASTGTTLLELILVIALLTIVAALSGPLLLQLFQRQGADAAARTVASRLEQARSRGLLDMQVPMATFSYDVARYEAASATYVLDNGWRVTWAGGATGDQLALEFDTLGRLKSRTAPLDIHLQSPTAGPPMIVSITPSGLVTWRANE